MKQKIFWPKGGKSAESGGHSGPVQVQPANSPRTDAADGAHGKAPDGH